VSAVCERQDLEADVRLRRECLEPLQLVTHYVPPADVPPEGRLVQDKEHVRGAISVVHLLAVLPHSPGLVHFLGAVPGHVLEDRSAVLFGLE